MRIMNAVDMHARKLLRLVAYHRVSVGDKQTQETLSTVKSQQAYEGET